MVSDGKSERNHFLDVLKGLCIIFIVVTHYAWTDSEQSIYLFPFWIDMAVPIFMIISGFVYAKSLQKHNIISIGEAYYLKNTCGKIIRYAVPFTIAFIIEESALIITGRLNPNISHIILSYIQGGVGPGSYYFPVMIQLIFVFPMLYFIILKYDFKGLLLCMILNGVFEVLQRAYNMNQECYRLLLFRYIFIIAFGCYLAIGKKRIKPTWYVVSFLIGIAFIILFNYTSYKPIIIVYWSGTCFLTCLFIVPIAFILIQKVNFHFKPLEILGKASFNIFLVQMVYYKMAAGGFVYKLIDNRVLQLIMNIVICLIAGVVFYYVETPFTKFITMKVNKLVNNDDMNKKTRKG